MSITVIDYGSGNLKSAAKALELAANNINTNSKIVVTSDPQIIKQSDKIKRVLSLCWFGSGSSEDTQTPFKIERSCF